MLQQRSNYFRALMIIGLVPTIIKPLCAQICLPPQLQFFSFFSTNCSLVFGLFSLAGRASLDSSFPALPASILSTPTIESPSHFQLTIA